MDVRSTSTRKAVNQPRVSITAADVTKWACDSGPASPPAGSGADNPQVGTSSGWPTSTTPKSHRSWRGLFLILTFHFSNGRRLMLDNLWRFSSYLAPKASNTSLRLPISRSTFLSTLKFWPRTPTRKRDLYLPRKDTAVLPTAREHTLHRERIPNQALFQVFESPTKYSYI